MCTSLLSILIIILEMHAREREREEAKVRYKREIDEFLEEAERALRTREAAMEKDRNVYEQRVREKFDKLHEETRAELVREREHLQLEEDQRASKYQAMVVHFHATC